MESWINALGGRRGDPLRTRQRACRWLAGFALLAVFLPAAMAQPTPPAPPDVRVYDDGPFMLVRYTTDGKQLGRLTGFGAIAQLALYDDTTVLVAESDRGRITAVGLDGTVKWTTPVRNPRCVQVLDPDRLLVCQGGPPGVAEIDRAGNVLWEVSKPLLDAAGAGRLPDGNTAVVEGNVGRNAVLVINPRGDILWSATKDLANPRGLAVLPSGEVVTSAFDRPELVIFTPYTERMRAVPACCHVEGPTVTASGEIIAAIPEGQKVEAWAPEGSPRWRIETLYPPYGGVLLPDGTVAASEYRVPDRSCMNAGRAAERAARPLASHWRWFLGGIGGALLGILVLQFPALRGPVARSKSPAVASVGSDVMLSTTRRAELALYLAAALGFGGAAWFVHAHLLRMGQPAAWPYFGLVVAGGVFLALIQYRLPRSADDWTHRMKRLEPMAPTNWRMWVLWIAGLALVGIALEGVWHQSGVWAEGAWAAGVLFLAGGSVQRPQPLALSRWELGAAVVVGGLLLVPRLCRLGDIPANLHHDMGLWTLQAFRLLDGDVPSLFANGWADIPMPGYLWPAAIAAFGDRSLAAARIEAVAASMLALLATYGLVNRWYGRSAGLLAVVLLGMHQGFVHFSRIQAYMDPVPFAVLAMWGLVAGIETGKYGWFALCGIAGGISGLSYHAGRITPPLLALWALLLLVRYPRAILRRWPGLLLAALVLTACLTPQALLYLGERAYALGRSDQFVWIHHADSMDWESLRTAIMEGIPQVFGSYWFFRDTSSQYGGPMIFFPPVAALLGMFACSALLRPQDLRGVLTVVWGAAVLFAGGVLTLNPPFWPRLLIALVPACAAAGAGYSVLARAASVALGRAGQLAALAGGIALAAGSTYGQLASYWYWVGAGPSGSAGPRKQAQSASGRLGRDAQSWGSNAMVYIVASNANLQSCTHPATMFYVDSVDAQDARQIADYMPFRDPRTIVIYVSQEMSSSIDTVRRMYPNVMVEDFFDSIDNHIFTRLVIPAPHRPAQ